jgi:ABC-type nitrate/sulfonate/bicarbonate transport system substrate-binding protein
MSKRARPGLRPMVVAAFLALLALTAAACGGGAETAPDGADGDGTDGEAAPAEQGEPTVVRFAFAPDAVVDYMVDTGRLAELEDEWNVTLEMTEAFDEFAFFAGGHGDVVSTSSHEVAALEQETDIRTVTFGRYNHNHTQILVRSDSDYQTLEDLAGERIAVGSQGSMSTWGAFVADEYGLDFTFEGGDYEIVLNDHAANPELLARGEVEACLCPTELAAPQHARGEVRALYDATISELWREEQGHYGIMQNVFTATEEFYDSHPREIAFFLALWEEGIQAWHENSEEIIRQYPHHFNVEADEDIQWVVDYLGEHDWNVESVYFDEEWIEGEQAFIQNLKDTGFLDADLPETRFEPWTAEDVQAQLDGAAR